MSRIRPSQLAQAGAATNDVLTWDGAKWAAAAGASSSLTVQDENSNVSTTVTQIDFHGPGVTATAGTGEVIVTVKTSAAFAQRTAGDVTAPNGLSAWAAVDTALDLTLPAAVGDKVEISLTASWGSSSTVNGRLRPVSIVSGSVVNVLAGSTNYGVAAWSNPLGVQYSGASGTVMYAVQSGDLSSGQITVRLEVRADGTGQSIRANSDAPLHFSLKNLGQ